MAKNDNQDLAMDDGTEGATLGYITPGRSVLDGPKEEPDNRDDRDDSDDNDVEDDLDDEDVDDKEDSEDDDDEPDTAGKREKELERMYTAKFRELSKQRGMIDLMEKVQADPQKMVPWLAKRLGVKLGNENANKKEDKYEPANIDLSNMTPTQDESMPAYIQRVFSEGMKAMMAEIPKVVAASTKKATPDTDDEPEPLFPKEDPVQAALKHLDAKYDDWPLYEDDMIAVLKEKPNLINDPDKLYKAGKKRSPLMQKRSRLKQERESKRFSTGQRGKGGKRNKTSNANKVMSFGEAWERAKRDTMRRR